MQYSYCMEMPATPVEQIDSADFKPPHCPSPRCPQHRLPPGEKMRFYVDGSFPRKCDRRWIPRYRCRVCGKGMSQQTFSVTYYLKRPELLPHVAAGLNAGSAHRQLARSLGCDPSTVTRQAERIARHCILLSAKALEEIDTITETVVYDHFESFVYSQDLPVGLGTAVGHRSWYVYDQQLAPHGRGGKISPVHKKRQEDFYRLYGKPPRGEYRKSTRACLDLLLKMTDGVLDLVTDGHKAYERAVNSHPLSIRIRHRIFPNPPRVAKGSPRSPEAIERDRAMFPCDLLHALIRHTCIPHKRETIAFGRRHNSMAGRGFLLMVWRNFIKWRSERKRDRTTPAMVLGLTDRPWEWRQVLSKRLFPTLIEVPKSWMKVYRGDWITRAVGNNRRHRLKNAY